MLVLRGPDLSHENSVLAFRRNLEPLCRLTNGFLLAVGLDRAEVFDAASNYINGPSTSSARSASGHEARKSISMSMMSSAGFKLSASVTGFSTVNSGSDRERLQRSFVIYCAASARSRQFCSSFSSFFFSSGSTQAWANLLYPSALAL